MTRVSTGRLVAQYVLSLIGTLIVAVALLWAAENWANYHGRNPALGFVVIYAAAASTGSFWWKREPEAPTGRRWQVALVCALLTIALQAALAGLVIWAGVSVGKIHFQSRDGMVLAGVLAAAAVLQLLVIRIAIGLTFRQCAKQARLRAEKASKA